MVTARADGKARVLSLGGVGPESRWSVWLQEAADRNHSERAREDPEQKRREH